MVCSVSWFASKEKKRKSRISRSIFNLWVKLLQIPWEFSCIKPPGFEEKKAVDGALLSNFYTRIQSWLCRWYAMWTWASCFTSVIPRLFSMPQAGSGCASIHRLTQRLQISVLARKANNIHPSHPQGKAWCPTSVPTLTPQAPRA